VDLPTEVVTMSRIRSFHDQDMGMRRVLSLEQSKSWAAQLRSVGGGVTEALRPPMTLSQL
jgi:hypothetical protein